VVGETPNFAARLQVIAEPNTVVISDSTRRLLGNLFEFEDLGAKDLKGISAPMRAWAALRPSAVESRFEALHASNLTALVGREEELELLLRRWSKAKGGEGQVVLLSGEAGIGKSRLTAALLERLAGEPHTRLRYFCSPQHTDSALYPVIGQMERAAGFVHDDSPQAKLDKLDAVLADTSTRMEDAALFAEMLSLPNDGRHPSLELTPEQRRQRTLSALVSQMEALARQNPVLMIFEDAHWTDPTSLEAFGRTVDRIETLPALLIVTFRPEFTAPWAGQSHVTSITLNRLGEREAAAIIARLVGNKELPADVMAEILGRTDGIPLFVEEMTKAVLEAESEGEARRTVAAVPSPALAVPASLHASLMARLDRLGPAKEMVQIAAAIGREFSHALLAAVVRKQEAELGLALDRLIQAGLLFRQGVPPHATYVFKHALVQDVAYSTLLRSRRQKLHARIAATLEDQFPETVAAQPALVAWHCAEAGLVEKAVVYWLKAGQQALARSAMTEAVALLRKGLAVLSDMPNYEHRQRDELEFQIALGQAFQAVKGPASPEAGEAYARARTLCEQLNKPAQLAPVLFGIWIHHLMRGELEASRQDAIMWQRLAEDQKDLRLRVMGHRIRGQSEFLLGDIASARTNLEQGLALFKPADRPYYATLTPQDGRVLMLCFLSNALAAMGYVDQSLDSAEDAVAEARRLGHRYTLAIALALSLPQYCIGGRAAHSPSEALRRSKELEVLSTQHGLSSFLGNAMVWRGLSLAALGNPQQGVEVIKQGIAAMRASGVSSFIPYSITQLADAYGMAGQPAAGLEWLGEAISIIEATGERWYEAEIRRLRGDLLRAAGDDTTAEASFRDAIAVASKQQAKLFELRASTSLSRLRCDRGKRTEARELLAPVYGWFTEGFDTLDLKEAKALLEQLAI
jgi:predicted ATPase